MFFAANVWSALLIIGNPTNVIVGTGFQLDFVTYSAWLALPSIFSGFTLLVCLALYFRKEWTAARIDSSREMTRMEAPRVDALSAVIGAVLLLTTLVLMFVLSFWGVPLWSVGLACGVAFFIKDIALDCLRSRTAPRDGAWLQRRFPITMEVVGRLPPTLIPFMFGMFVLVGTLPGHHPSLTCPPSSGGGSQHTGSSSKAG